jgi:hypothetical protein
MGMYFFIRAKLTKAGLLKKTQRKKGHYSRRGLEESQLPVFLQQSFGL